MALSVPVPHRELVAHERVGLAPGASSTDVRRTVRVEVAGTAPGPRPVLETGLEAVDHDEQTATVIVDRSRVFGDAVTPAGPDVPDTLLYRACDFGDRVTELAVTAAGAGAGEVTFFAGTGTAEPARVTVEPTDNRRRRGARTTTPPWGRPVTSGT
uniref:hypothetical protein n=1 Tax=Streptomyces sp. SJL17-4 TaxID=2967224 RepID=UPI00404016E0